MDIHLGCWHRYIDGFIHVDLCDFEHIDYRSDIKELPFFSDESANLIYSSHSFEYFDPVEAPLVLKEWRRVLKPGGKLRLSVPDFDQLIKIYQLTGNIQKILGPLFGRMQIESNGVDTLLYHKTVYNFDTLSKLLSENGFEAISRYNWQDTIHSKYDDHSQAYYPHMDKENGIMVSLNVEALKS